MKKQILIILVLISGIAILSSCGGGQKSANGQKKDTTAVVTNKTTANLIAAIKGETTDSQKYTACAKKAREENLVPVAILFEAASVSETTHIRKQTKALENLGGKMVEFKPEFTVKSTKENLEDAIKGETSAYTEMYPGYIKEANAQEFDDAVSAFTSAQDVEKKYAELFTSVLKVLNENKLNTLPANYSVCTVCGNVFDSKKAPASCEICGTTKEKFTVFK